MVTCSTSYSGEPNYVLKYYLCILLFDQPNRLTIQHLSPRIRCIGGPACLPSTRTPEEQTHEQFNHPPGGPGHRRRRLRRPLPTAPGPRPGPEDPGAGGRRRRRWHLVLEPLPRRALRRGEPGLLLLLQRRVATGMELERALRTAARDPALHQPRGRPFRFAQGHPVQQPREERHLRRKPCALDGGNRGR